MTAGLPAISAFSISSRNFWYSSGLSYSENGSNPSEKPIPIRVGLFILYDTLPSYFGSSRSLKSLISGASFLLSTSPSVP